MKEFLFLECEKSKDGDEFLPSEYLFWKEVIGFKGDIICCGGNRGIKNEIVKYSSNITDGDKVYVFLDEINAIYGDANINEILMSISKICNVLRCISYINIDFCFESMILRSKVFWEAWLNKLCCGDDSLRSFNNYIAQLHVCLVKSFNKDAGGRDALIPTLNYLWGSLKSKNKTSEQAIASLVHDMSHKSGFEVSKGCLGYCWLYDCGFISTNVSGYYADKSVGCNQNSVGTLSLLCHKNLCDDIKNNISDTKRKIILDDLCNGDWHNLFEPL